MTWGVGFISQWPILLLQGLEMIGKKYDLHLHVDAPAGKTISELLRFKRSGKEVTSETHIVLDRREMTNTTAASSSTGAAAATTGTSSEREDCCFSISAGSIDHSGRYDSPKSVFRDVACLETLSANRRRE